MDTQLHLYFTTKILECQQIFLKIFESLGYFIAKNDLKNCLTGQNEIFVNKIGRIEKIFHRIYAVLSFIFLLKRVGQLFLRNILLNNRFFAQISGDKMDENCINTFLIF